MIEHRNNSLLMLQFIVASQRCVTRTM